MPPRTREPLNRQRIIDAALRIVDSEGLEALTMRHLAEELGVEGASLYKHIPNKAAVLLGILHTISTEVEVTYPPEYDWKERLRIGMTAFRAQGLRHPNAFFLSTRPWEGILADRREGDMKAMIDAGFSIEQAAVAFRTLLSYTVGYTARECAALARDPAEVEEAQAESVINREPERFPHIVASQQFISGADSNALFRMGLEAIIQGIESELLSKQPLMD